MSMKDECHFVKKRTLKEVLLLRLRCESSRRFVSKEKAFFLFFLLLCEGELDPPIVIRTYILVFYTSMLI